MNIATGSILNMAPAGHDWVIAFDYGGEDGADLVCPVIGWATVVSAHDAVGAATTSIQPAFLHQDMVWTPAELREFDHEVGVWNIRARVIPGAAAAQARLKEWEAVLAPRPASEASEDDAGPEVRALHSADGWTVPYEPGTQTCTINHVPEDEGRKACAATAVWKVVEHRDFGLTLSFWCDTDLPAEHRHLAARPAA